MLNKTKHIKLFGLGEQLGIKPVFYFVIIVLFSFESIAQDNLVPNGSFEEYEECPMGTADFQTVKDWYNPTLASPDYYNECDDTYGAGIPQNDWGYQYAQDGQAYAGLSIISFDKNEPNYREYIQVKLTQPLEKSVLYCWSFYVSLLDNIDYVSNNISLAFSKDSVLLNNSSIIPLSPFYKHNSIITDSINWVQITGEYLSIGEENYLTIGNFSTNNATNSIKIGSNTVGGPYSYYYIDNVYFGKCKTNISFPNVFTPNNDNINDVFIPRVKGIRNYQLSIMNRWGNKVFYTEDASQGWNGKFEEIECTNGVYFFQCIFIDEKNIFQVKTGFIHLIR